MGDRHEASLLEMDELPRDSTRGQMHCQELGWILKVYLKYIQSEVTVSLSCAGFYNSPFSISHVRLIFSLSKQH